jgi:hypothetical protein
MASSRFCSIQAIALLRSRSPHPSLFPKEIEANKEEKENQAGSTNNKTEAGYKYVEHLSRGAQNDRSLFKYWQATGVAN